VTETIEPIVTSSDNNNNREGNNRGTLFLIPTNLSTPFSLGIILPATVIATIHRLDYYIAENAKNTRAFLVAAGVSRPIASIHIAELDKHAKNASVGSVDSLLAPLLNGHDVGLVSDAGAPGVADPGANIAAAAHRRGIVVRPQVGPSSILLGLMASGLNGQTFAFQGYLAQEKLARIAAIKTLERESKQKNMTQLFIETPYRNQVMIQDLLASLSPGTRLCIASDLTGEKEFIQTKTIAAWRQSHIALERLPTLFLFLA